jgi:hypothetical protein
MAPDTNLQGLLSELESRTTGMDHFDIAQSFSKFRQQSAPGAEEAFGIEAEEIAFSLSERADRADGSPYFGPQIEGKRADGTIVRWPDVGSLEPRMIEYWAARSTATHNPFLRKRYADLVWELSPLVAGKRQSVSYAHAAIDSAIEAIERGMFKWPIAAENNLRRVLDLSLSINDAARAVRVVEAILAIDDAIATAGRGRGFAFDSLLASSKTPLSTEQRAKLIGDMEAHLAELGGATVIIPVEVERIVDRLLGHYRRAGDRNQEHRVLRLYKSIIEKGSTGTFPMLASSGLDRVHRVLTEAGLREDAEAMIPLMRQANAAALAEMKAVSVTVEIPREELDAWLDKLLTGDPREVLMRWARAFLPDPAQVEERARSVAQEHQVSSMFHVDLRGDDGRPIALVGALEDDLDGQLVIAMSSELAMAVPQLRMTTERLAGKFDVAKQIVGLLQGSVFDPQRTELVARGLTAYLSGDYVAALCILIPEIEAAVRRLALLSGTPIEKRSRLGGLDFKNLGDFLAEAKVRGVLTERVATYLRVLLTDRRGWNLRNSVSHGLLQPAAMGSEAADRIVHAVLVLGAFRVNESTSHVEPEP